MAEQFGKQNDLIDDMNGSNGQVVYLQDADPDRLALLFNSIKVGKQIINAYSIGEKHVLAIYLDKKAKINKG